jgi:CheY-like chemotaxis protein
VATILRKNGYDVDLAGNGREALAALEGGRYDLVLMDIQMPELDGISAARLIRQQARWNSLPIVAMTAHALNGDREKCLEAGMNGYLSKPVAPPNLIDTVREFIKGKAAPRKPAAPAANVLELPSPIDRVLAARLMDNDAALMSGMSLLFLQLAPERLQKLQSAAARMDTVALCGQAQKLEKAAERIAAVDVARCAREVGERAAAEDYQALQDQLQALEGEIRRLDEHMRTRQEAGV